jgi:maleylacetoacetate isomerase/maleylpyruvate isomerase
MKLFGYWRSTAAYRVRIALHLKEIEFESISVHLVKGGGEQHTPDYVNLNPTKLVPTLVDGDFSLNQSLAIIDYIENISTQSPLYPSAHQAKAKVQALALDIACEIHPLNNLRVQQYLANTLSVDNQAKQAWVEHWMNTGFKAIEQQLSESAGDFCFGKQVTVADICLVAQVYNANRFNVDMSSFPIINRIVQHCNTLPAFIKALPENQSDAQ